MKAVNLGRTRRKITAESDASIGREYYLRARYMNPANGRFTQHDSFNGIGRQPMSLHKYAYANDNPIVFTDPSGHFGISEFGAAGNIAGALSTTSTPGAGGKFFSALKDGADLHYRYHASKFNRYGGKKANSIPRVSGSYYGGEVNITQTVGAMRSQGVSDAEVSSFIAGAESLWNGTFVSPSGLVYTIRVNLIGLVGGSPDIPIHRSSSTFGDGKCRANVGLMGYPDYNTDYEVRMCADDPAGVAAHEYGHVLGFGDAYQDSPNGTSIVQTSPADLMANSYGGVVHWFHARLLIERYKGRR